VPVVREFFRDIDQNWGHSSVGRIRLQIIGSTALMLQANYDRGTKDSDVLETAQLREPVRSKLLRLAGVDSDIHRRHHLYIDIVSNGIPFLPQSPLWRSREDLSCSLDHFDVDVLDVVDVVVSKLKRFNLNDQTDIDAMVERGLVSHESLIGRFNAAVDYWSTDARADDLPKYVSNLHRVERDFFVLPETEIELPSWVR
jgi:hypothetical protein